MHRFQFAFLALSLVASPSHAADTLIVLNKEDASVWLIDPRSGETRAKIEVGEGPHEAAVSPDGRTAVVSNYGAASDGNTLSVIDVVAGVLRAEIDLAPRRRPHGIAYHPDGKRVFVTVERSEEILQVDIERGEASAVYDAGGDVHMLAYEPSAQRIFATAIGKGQLCEISLSQTSLRTLDTAAGTEAIALRPGTRELWVGNNRLHKLLVVDRSQWKVVSEIDCGRQPIRIAFTLDGAFALVSGFRSDDLIVVDAARRRIERRIHLDEGARPIGVLVGPDDRFIYVACRGRENVAVIDRSDGSIVRRLKTGAGPDGMAYSRVPEDSR